MKKRFYSTRRQSPDVDLREAIIHSLPSDGGLYLPKHWPHLPLSFFRALSSMTIQEIALYLSQKLLGEEIPLHDLQKIVEASMTFEAPLRYVTAHTHVLELFHGPTLAFKDFGARFMAQLMSYLWKQEEKDLVVLVATSGDTGGAVADGFYQVPGIRIVILYPSGKVSPLQEKQLTTYQGNITACEVQGTFDDCQRLVKEAFLDHDLSHRLHLTSANSINLARLYPQMFYYFSAVAQLPYKQKTPVFCVPSGNFGNLTAGLIAHHLGLKAHFIAATNSNDVVYEYSKTGEFRPRKSMRTLSNAMDVGNPSNFPRILELLSSGQKKFQDVVSVFSSSDAQTVNTLHEYYERHHYLIDPHTAVGFHAWEEYKKGKDLDHQVGVVLSTAHPAKFIEVVEQATTTTVPLPHSLYRLIDLPKVAMPLSADFSIFKEFLIRHYGS